MRGVPCGRLLFCLAPFFAVSLAFTQQNPVQQAAPEAAQRVVTVTVLDHDHHPVTGLKAEDFILYVGERPQPITAVTSANVPACIGILVDQSGSMRQRLPAITSAVADFVRSGNPENQVFLVLFNDDPYLDQDFTSDPAKIETALKRAEARGGTAFYDSLIATADHLAENKACNKRVVLALTDGRDNESRKTQLNAYQLLQESGTPQIYSIGVPEANGISGAGRRTLEFFGNMSGGAAFFANGSGDIRKAAHRILEELGSQYRISYEAPAGSGSNVKVYISGRKDAAVRVNAGTPITHVAASAAARGTAGNSPASASIAAGPPIAQPRGPDCISGTVVDEDQNPVARVRVEAMPAFGPNPYAGSPNPYSVTDTQGRFRLAELVKGNYRLYTRPEGYSPRQGPIYRNEDRTPIASSDSCADVTVKFLTRFATLKVHVIDAVTHEPIPNSVITLRNNLGEGSSMSRFDREAGIRVPPGMELTVRAWVAGQHHMSDPITLTTPAAGTSQEITVELDQRPSTPVKNP
jgi:Ca-activated chloride channel homolog